jgi:hypothetical protein
MGPGSGSTVMPFLNDVRTSEGPLGERPLPPGRIVSSSDVVRRRWTSLFEKPHAQRHRSQGEADARAERQLGALGRWTSNRSRIAARISGASMDARLASMPVRGPAHPRSDSPAKWGNLAGGHSPQRRGCLSPSRCVAGHYRRLPACLLLTIAPLAATSLLPYQNSPTRRILTVRSPVDVSVHSPLVQRFLRRRQPGYVHVHSAFSCASSRQPSPRTAIAAVRRLFTPLP